MAMRQFRKGMFFNISTQRFERLRKPRGKADQALAIAKSNKKLIRSLHEPSDVKLLRGSTALNATPVIDHITESIVGDGSSVTLKSFRIRGVIKQNLTSAIVDDYRMDIVMDRRSAGVEITPLLYLGLVTPDVDVFKLFDSKERYKILRTIRGHLSSSEGSNSFREIDEYVKLNVVATTKLDGNWTQANILTNAIYVVFWTTATANQPTIQFTSQIVTAEG